MNIRCYADVLDVTNGIQLFPSDKIKTHHFLVDSAVHIAASEKSASFLVATFYEVTEENPKSVLPIDLKVFGRCQKFLRKTVCKFISSFSFMSHNKAFS